MCHLLKEALKNFLGISTVGVVIFFTLPLQLRQRDAKTFFLKCFKSNLTFNYSVIFISNFQKKNSYLFIMALGNEVKCDYA